MHYYQAPDKSLHALDDASFAYLLPAGCTELTEAEYAALTAPAAPTMAQQIAMFESAVQGYLDQTAQSWQYESILSAASYAASTVPKFKAEAAALIAWRDAVWTSCYATLAAVQGGTQAAPASTDAFIATLPAAPTRPTV